MTAIAASRQKSSWSRFTQPSAASTWIRADTRPVPSSQLVDLSLETVTTGSETLGSDGSFTSTRLSPRSYAGYVERMSNGGWETLAP